MKDGFFLRRKEWAYGKYEIKTDQTGACMGFKHSDVSDNG